jgi:hypothetical protein
MRFFSLLYGKGVWYKKRKKVKTSLITKKMLAPYFSIYHSTWSHYYHILPRAENQWSYFCILLRGLPSEKLLKKSMVRAMVRDGGV